MFEGKNGMHSENSDELGDNHVGTSAETPLRKDAFELSDAEKIVKIEESVQEIHEIRAKPKKIDRRNIRKNINN